MRARKPLALSLYFHGLPPCIEEFRFHPTRRWRFDLAWPVFAVAVEQDGGIWTGGRHSGGAGQIKDMEKLNNAALLGWRVFRFTPQQIRNGQARLFMTQVFNMGGRT